MALKGLRVITGICGIAAPILVFSLIILAIGLSPWFDWNRNALSDLGVSGVAAFLFNSSLIVGGLLLFFFSVGLRQVLPRGRLSVLGTIILSLDMLVLCGIGLFPETAGRIHLYLSIAFFTLFPLSLIIIGVSELLQRDRRTTGALTILASISVVLVWTFRWGGVAVPETISSLIGAAWVITKAVRLIRPT